MTADPVLSAKLPSKSYQLLDRSDAWIALGVALVALLAYIRTLAPDMLYSDSAEFQALSYSLGIAHTSGYPVFLLLGKFFGSILPFGSFAYRINMLSAIYAAGTLSGIYLLGRAITSSRIGPVLGCAALGLAYSFWSQAVIAEIYTLATLVLTWGLFYLWHWQDEPTSRGKWILVTLLLFGLGIHTVVEQVVPAVGVLILVTLWRKRLPARQWSHALAMVVAGGAIGAVIFFSVFYLSDTVINPSTSFLNVTLIPSRSLWGAEAGDLDSFFKRVCHTVIPLQWGNDLFSGDSAFMSKSLGGYWDALIQRDFTVLILITALVG